MREWITFWMWASCGSRRTSAQSESQAWQMEGRKKRSWKLPLTIASNRS